MNLFYGLSGEGLGHAIRTQAILDYLPKNIAVHLFTYGDAYQFFRKQNYPHLHLVDGIHFGRTATGRIDLLSTAGNFLNYLYNLRHNVSFVIKKAKELKPELFVSDFDGVIPRVAQCFGKPLLSIDNQHRFSRTVDEDLPFNLKLYSFVMGRYTEWSCPNPDLAVISTFHHAVLKKAADKTVITNCFMRKFAETIVPTAGDYVLLYYRAAVGDVLLNALAGTKEKIVVFRCPEDKRVPGANYQDLGNEEFLTALASCKAVFCAAGNQLLGEATYFGKPIFCVPEPNQAEQSINAHYVVKTKIGTAVDIDKVSTGLVEDFLKNLQWYQSERQINGVHIAVEAIENACRCRP